MGRGLVARGFRCPPSGFGLRLCHEVPCFFVGFAGFEVWGSGCGVHPIFFDEQLGSAVGAIDYV